MTQDASHIDPANQVCAAAYRAAPAPRSSYPLARPTREAKTLATLSLIFSFVFPPVGAVLGHLALSRVDRQTPRYRGRALVGLSLSYVFILVAVVALPLLKVTAIAGTSSVAGSALSGEASAVAPFAPHTQTRVVATVPPVRQSVHVAELRAGDCMELQQIRPDPSLVFIQQVRIFPVNCAVRDGVFQVYAVSSSAGPCGDEFLANGAGTIFACISKFDG